MKIINILHFFLIIIAFACNKKDDVIVRPDLIKESEVVDFSDVTTFETLVSNDTLKIPIVHHISRRNDGTGASANATIITKVMSDINNNYKTGKIQFYTREVRFLDNSSWNEQFIKQDDFNEKKVLKEFEDNKALNLFYFKTLLSNGNSIGATALFPQQGNNVKLSASSTDSNNTATITHEIGHYLGLYHTDDDFKDNQGRIELVDGSNCNEAGDKICDTPASPVIRNSNMRDCVYIGTETDPNNERYNPDTFNFMTSSGRTRADALGLCRRRFTLGQIAKMVNVLNNERSYLITRE